jgi:dephospho-CoA kinase
VARPRVFISSTFYDLMYVRTDLEKFIESVGYEPVMHERGHVPYGSAEKLEHYCYREIDQVDMVVHVIGGRFGATSFDKAHSVSQMELKAAVTYNKQTYICIEKAVHSAYRHYLNNKGVKGIKYEGCEDERILAFIEEVELMPRNNQTILFETTDAIIVHLREQWAGLFQRFLQEQETAPSRRVAEEMENTLKTLSELVTYLAKTNQNQSTTIEEILRINHPVFQRFKTLTQTPYRVFFTDRVEMAAWLNARSWKTISEFEWDSPDSAEFIRADKRKEVLRVSLSLFSDAGKLLPMTLDDWNDSLVTVEDVTPAVVEDPFEDFPTSLPEDDDVPF